MAEKNDKDIIKAFDILTKFDFFYGQRAGRELWNEKPVDVQDMDIETFSNDVVFLKDFIKRQQAEIEKYQNAVKAYAELLQVKVDEDERLYATEIKGFWKMLTNRVSFIQVDSFHWAYVISEEDVDNCIKEMLGKEDEGK